MRHLNGGWDDSGGYNNREDTHPDEWSWAQNRTFDRDGYLATESVSRGSRPPTDEYGQKVRLTRDQRRALALVTYTQYQAETRTYGGRRIR